MRKTDPVGGLPSGAAGGVLAGSYPNPSLAAQAPGSVLLWDAAGNPLVYGPGTAGQVLTAQGVGTPPIWAANSATAGQTAVVMRPHRKSGFFTPVGTAGGSQAFGISAPANAGAGTSQVILQDSSTYKGVIVFAVAGTTIGNSSGPNGPYVQTAAACLPRLEVCAYFRGANTYKLRTWIGLSSATLTGLVVQIGTAASAVKFAAVCWDVNVSANFILASGDGVNYSGIDTGIAVPADDFFNFVIDWSVGGRFSVTYQRNGVATDASPVSLGTKATNLIGAADVTALGIQATQTTVRNGDNAAVYVSSIYLEQN